MIQELNNLLEYCTVKLTISCNSDPQWGSGFFVAPGLILTCAHVIQCPNGDYVKEGIKVSDRNRRSLPDASLNKLGKEYDLALLRLNLPETINPPCVDLDPEFKPFDSLYTFGYPGVPLDGGGTSVTCESEGIGLEQGKEVILFKSGQIYPGISGSPLLNYRTGKVCGIVKFTRDRDMDLGGGAIPTKVILEQFEELSLLQRRFHQQDKRWSNSLQFQRAGVGIEDAESIEFTAEELDPVKNSSWLSFVALLPVELIKCALREQNLSISELEMVLKGKNVTAARQQLDSFNRSSENQLSSIAGEIRSLEQRQQNLTNKIKNIELMLPPEDPIRKFYIPNQPLGGLHHNPEYDYQRNLYQQELADYKRAQALIPEYKRQKEPIPQQIARLNAELQEIASESNRMRELLEAKIAPARDRDIINLLNQVQTEAFHKLNHVTTELDGFVGLLSEIFLGNYLQSYIYDPSSKILVRDSVQAAAERLNEFLQDNTKNLVRQLLLSAALLNAGNESGRKLLVDIKDYLEQLPLDKMREAKEHSSSITEKKIEMFDFQKYLDEPDPQIQKQQLQSIKIERAKIENRILEVKDFLLATRELKFTTQTKVSKARQIVSDFLDRYENLLMSLNHFQLVWELIEYAANNYRLETSMGVICLNLQELILQKFQHSAKELMKIASKTQFEVPTAIAYINNHESLQFLASQSIVEQHLKDLSTAREKYRKVEAIDLPKQQAKNYKFLLLILHVVAVIPLVNVISLLIVRQQIRRLKPTLTSQEREYQNLARYLFKLCLWFLILQSALIVTFALGYLDNLLLNIEELNEIKVIMISFFYSTSWIISIINLCTLRNYNIQSKKGKS